MWIMYAYERNGKFWHIGSRRYVEMHYLKDPIVQVCVHEDPNGEYYGWLRDRETEPRMIWPNKTLFDVCFEYGFEVAEQRGHGHHVRLTITRKDGEEVCQKECEQ